jgi:hypothetical protein
MHACVHTYKNISIHLSNGSTAQIGPWAPHLRFLNHTQLIHDRTPLDEWSARCRGLYLYRTTQHINTWDKHPCPERIRTSDPSNQAATDLRLRPHGNWDRHKNIYIHTNIHTHIYIHIYVRAYIYTNKRVINLHFIVIFLILKDGRQACYDLSSKFARIVNNSNCHEQLDYCNLYYDSLSLCPVLRLCEADYVYYGKCIVCSSFRHYHTYSVFCYLTSCTQVDTDRWFRGAYCLHQHGDFSSLITLIEKGSTFLWNVRFLWLIQLLSYSIMVQWFSLVTSSVNNKPTAHRCLSVMFSVNRQAMISVSWHLTV